MPRIHRLTSFDLPELDPYRSMRRQIEHEQKNIFVAEGEKVVRRLLESNLETVSVLLPDKWLADFTALCANKPESIDIFVAEKKILEELTGFSMYQGVLAVGKIPPCRSLDHILESSEKPLLLLAVEGVSSAENLGGLIRNCAAFGASAILIGETTCSPWLRRSVRSSMGTIFRLPTFETHDLAETLTLLTQRNIRCLAAHPHTDQRALADADFRSDCCIVLGSEGLGLSERVLQICAEAIAIPMRAGVDSLNVGTAGAVFLYEARRQRG
jgi:tRNA G18 (ribose-2'-O)-methylase SpoU